MALKIVSETECAAGVRRIEALTSEGLMNTMRRQKKKLKECGSACKATPDNLHEKIHHLTAENKTYTAKWKV